MELQRVKPLQRPLLIKYVQEKKNNQPRLPK